MSQFLHLNKNKFLKFLKENEGWTDEQIKLIEDLLRKYLVGTIYQIPKEIELASILKRVKKGVSQ